jgi:DNA-binding response OmpR family regulator
MEGYKISTSDNGEKGLADAKKKKPDIILLDVLLPKMDGFTVLKELKADAGTKGIPVILPTNISCAVKISSTVCLKLSMSKLKSSFK